MKGERLRLVRHDAVGAAGERRGTPFQGAAFVDAWKTTRGVQLGSEAWLLQASDDGATLPLEIVRRGPLRIGRFPGETHANANGWRLTPGSAPPSLTPADLAAAAADAGMRIDAVDLRRIPDPGWLGTGFGITEAFEKRFAVSLGAGFEAVLARGNGKRKRKKFRQQQRHFAERGGYRFLDVPSDQRIATLDVFLEQKKDRFRTLDMPDPFADPGIRAFLIALFLDPAADSRLYVIESGGVTKALLGGIVEDGTFWGMFSSFADDADAGISPGELLLWHMVEALAAEGLAALDLGPGAERYKEAWCDLSVAQYDAITALTLRGRAYVAAAQLKAVARNRVKRSRRLTALAQKLRRRFRGN